MFLYLSFELLHWHRVSAERWDFCPLDSICNEYTGQKTTKSHICAVVKLVQRKSACSIDKFDFYSVQNWLGFKEARNERLERLIYIVEKKWRFGIFSFEFPFNSLRFTSHQRNWHTQKLSNFAKLQFLNDKI